MGRKLALIIGNSEYEDGKLARLVTPDADVNALAEVLRDPQVGGFDEVAALVDQPAEHIRRTVAGFFVGRERDDLLMLYFSGHGIRDDRGQLFLAAKDTELNLLRGTAIPASFITEEMDNSRSRRQLLILDCCHSGAFSRGMKNAPGSSVGTAAAFEGTGSGRVVLTATDSTQYAWEGDQVIGNAENSVFTHYLIQGLRTGEADTDADGRITLDELYTYVYEQVIQETPRQTPGKWSYGQQGEMVIARNPHPVVKPVDLPLDLQQTINDPRPWVREGAVKELDRLLQGSYPALALAAHEALKLLANDDSRRVATMAGENLAAYDEAQRVREEAGREAQREEQESTARVHAEAERARREKAESEAQARQVEREEQERRLRQQAEAERESHKKAEQKRLESEKSDMELRPVEKIQVDTGRGVSDVRPAFALGKLPWAAILVVTIGWAIGWAILGAAFAKLPPYGSIIDWSELGVIPGAIAGVSIGLALLRIRPSAQWKHVMMLTIGWTITFAITLAISWILYKNDMLQVQIYPGEIPFIIGGFIAGIVIPWVIPSISWKNVLVTHLSWTSVGVLLGVITGAIGGAITVLVLRWSDKSIQGKQVLIITMGWTIGLAIGLTIFTSIGGPINSVNDLAILGAISGAIAGVMGSGVTFWQLGYGTRNSKVANNDESSSGTTS